MAESTAEAVIKSVFISIFIILAICGNLLVCIAIKTNARLRTLTNYYVFNLAVADFLFGITGMPLILITTIFKKWVLGDALCQISGTLNTLFVLVSIWTLTLISVNRYFAVGRATSYRSIYKKKRVLGSIAFVWVFAGLMAVAPQIGWSRIVEGDNFCTIDGRKNISYSGAVITLAYIAPLIILVCLYMKIFHVLKEHEKTMAEMRSGSINARAYSEADFDTGSVDYSESMKVNNDRTSSLRKESRRENFPHASEENPQPFTIETGGLNSNSTAGSNAGGGTLDKDNNIDKRHNSNISGNKSEYDNVEITSKQNNVDQHNVEQDSVEQNNVEQDNLEPASTVTTPVEGEKASSPTSRDSRTASDSKVKLIIGEQGDSPVVTYSKEHVENGDLKDRHRPVRSLSGLAHTLKRKRTRTSKKLKKFVREARITRMLFVVVAFFFICWTPLVVGTILYAFNAEPEHFNMLSMGFVFACMNSICNPIIYAFMNKLFRRTFKEIFQKLFVKCNCKNTKKNLDTSS